MRRIRRLIAAVAILGTYLSAQAHGLEYSEREADRSRAGQIVDRYELEMMRGKVPIFTTVAIAGMEPVQVSAMGRIFEVRPAAIKRFRWGPSLAPAGHRLAGTIWYTIWFDEEDGPGQLKATLRLRADGQIVEKVER